MVSKKFVEEVGSQGMAGQVNGTGPFRLKEWRKGDAIIMEKFDDYYGGSSEIPPVGPACVDRAVFKVIPESASRVAALLSGDVDIINELPPHAISQVTQSPNAEVVTVNGTRSFFISLNNQKPPFDDVRVRQAANYALNKKLIIDRILNGKATPISGILSPDAFSHDPDLPTYDYDLEKARQLLAEAGYPDGLDVTLDVEGGFKDIAEAVGSVLTKAGIRTRLVVGEGTMLKQEWLSADQAREGDMWFTSWGNGSLDPVDIFDPVLATGARGNSAGYSNPELDSLLSQAGTLMDADKRTELYHQAQAIVNRDAPLIFLWVPQDIYGVSKRLSGWQPSADSRINLHDACVD
ncbi:ABC transporter substrate-binding protein [Marinobacterium aestuariivivens]|uniref:ABC transporter substrate-binding protein n=1 Tax=Marinobacterium aestuariivivens TaxID=1698799 RepID=UPI0036D41E90